MLPIQSDPTPAAWPNGWNPPSSLDTKLFKNFASYLHHRAALEILPSLNISKLDLANERQSMQRYADRAQRMQFLTADDEQIDGVIVWALPADGKEENYTKQNWILYLNGNGETYEDNLAFLNWYAKETGCNLISFNYRGVGESSGYPNCFKDLVIDADAVFQHLERHGVASNRILIHARSLGGAVGVALRALHEDGPICNERSLSSWGAVEVCLSGKISGSLFNLYLQAMGWNIQPLEDWEKIQGYKWVIVSPTDEVIDFKKASFYAGLRRAYGLSEKELEEQIPVIKLPSFYSELNGNRPEGHNIPLNSKVINDVWEEHKRMIQKAFKGE